VFSDGFQTVGFLYAVVAGLLVYGMYTTFDVSSQQSAEEASALVLMHQSAQAFPEPQRDQAQQAVVVYVNSVINDEWPALADGMGSPKTSKAINHLFKVYGPMEPDGRWSDQYSQSIDHLDAVVKLRNERIDQSRDSLPTIYWFLLFAGGFITILYLSLAQVGNKPMHALAVGLTATMIGLVIFLLIEMNYPFQGDIALSPEHFRNALTSITEVGSG
jgi:Ca2+/Na+ antiporter